jgi:hypothetical protein
MLKEASRAVLAKTIEDLDVLAQSLEDQGHLKEACAIDVVSNTIESFMKDPSTINGIQMLWNKYKNNFNEFIAKMKELVQRNRLSYRGDKNWLQVTLENLTNKKWNLTPDLFAVP